jgi:hypothetical protein
MPRRKIYYQWRIGKDMGRNSASLFEVIFRTYKNQGNLGQPVFMTQDYKPLDQTH